MAKDGVPFVLGSFGVAILCVALWLVLRWEVWRVLGVISFVFGAFCAYFFRDPDRAIPQEAGAVVSPGDGKVVEIVAEDDRYVGKGAQRVSIFLSLFDVHVNRVPVSGSVAGVTYNPGKYLLAFDEKASANNEQTHIGIKSERGPVAFKQIAGFIARRIVCTLTPGDSVRIGDRCGLIRFGSRVDILLPPGAMLRVQRGQRVRGGETIVGLLP